MELLAAGLLLGASSCDSEDTDNVGNAGTGGAGGGTGGTGGAGGGTGGTGEAGGGTGGTGEAGGGTGGTAGADGGTGGTAGADGGTGGGAGAPGDHRCFDASDVAELRACSEADPEPESACGASFEPCWTEAFDCCRRFRYCSSEGSVTLTTLCDTELGSGGACNSGQTAGEC